MIEDALLKELRSIVGPAHVSVTDTGIELYSYDASQAQGHPGAVVFPRDTGQVSRVVKAANAAGMDYIPRGFGTNLSGGTISLTRGLVICLSRMNKILKLCPDSRYAVVQPGVTNLEVQQALAPLGAFYAPDPASQKVATLGGNAGENSGGPVCLKYGVTSNHILGMEMVLADGDILRIGGPAPDPPGFDLRGLMIGSEGAFAIITELTLRTLPKAESVITMLAVYDSIHAAAQSVSDIISAGIVPSTLEMMDAVVIEAVEANAPCGYPKDAAAVLIIEVEGMQVGLNEQADRIEAICMNTRCRTIKTAENEMDRERLWQGRRGAFGAMARLAPNYLVNDACVPRTRLPEALDRVKTIAARHGCRVGNVFHAGDGNLHPLLLFDSRNPEEVEQVHKAGWDIMEMCADLGGTISGEHGIGREKRDAMRMVFSGDDLDTQQAVKTAFDPHNRLNPGKVIPLPESPGQPLTPGNPNVLKRRGGKTANGVPAAMKQIKSLSRSGRTIQVTGAQTLNRNGCRIPGPITRVSSLDMDGVIEFDPDNQFITVGAGMPVSDLQHFLKKRNQWLPVRPPFFTPESTTGGLAATDSSGPERMIYGAPRDLALGLQYIDSRGRMISTGGKVVKNVAGYDMTRLMIGSEGALGMITEVTWRISTRPETCCAATGRGTLKICLNAAVRLMNDPLSPAMIVLISDTVDAPGNAESSEDQWKIITGFEGLNRVVGHQTERCGHLFEKKGLRDVASITYDLYGGCPGNFFNRLEKSRFILKAGTAAEDLHDLYDAILLYTRPSVCMIDAGCGRIFTGLTDLTAHEWTNLTSPINATDRLFRIEKSPERFCDKSDMFGAVRRPEWSLMQTIKRALDPNGVFAAPRLPMGKTPVAPERRR